ncbi:MAG: HdeD family acid-resistance protein [Oscillospiraceae bacterium]
MKKLNKKRNNTYMVISIVSLILGLFLVIKPETSSNIISYIIGAGFVFYGVVHIITYILVKDESLFQYDLAKGLITTSIGLFFIFKPTFIASLLPLGLGIAILFNGVMSLQSACNFYRNSRKNWLSVFIPSLITIVFGALIIVNPFKWAKALLIIIGCVLIWNAIWDLWTHYCINKKVEELEKKASAIDISKPSIDDNVQVQEEK